MKKYRIKEFSDGTCVVQLNTFLFWNNFSSEMSSLTRARQYLEKAIIYDKEEEQEKIRRSLKKKVVKIYSMEELLANSTEEPTP